jgi:uncharacterized protein YkwD
MMISRLMWWVFCSMLTMNCANRPAPANTGSLSKNEIKKLSTDDISVAILYYVNLYRKSIGRVPIQPNSFESEVAMQHSIRMAKGLIPFGHEGFPSRIRMIEKQLGPMQSTAENVAMGQMTAREVVDTWLRSPSHRKNIEGNFILSGIGCARNTQGVIYYTEIFTR